MMNQTKLWYLQQINLFEKLSENQLAVLSKKSRMKEVSSKEVIYFVEDPSQTIYFLKKGKVKLVRVSPEGNEMILSLINSGELFGEIALTDEKGREDIAVAIDECLLCCIDKEEFIHIVHNNPHLSFELSKMIGLRLKRFSYRLENLIFRGARQRLLSLLNEFIQEFGTKINNEIIIDNFLTHREMGELIALQRQTVTSLMNDLKSEGLIDYNRKKTIIYDLQAFFKLSDSHK